MIRTMTAGEIPEQGNAKPESPQRAYCREALDEFVRSGAEACELEGLPVKFSSVRSAMGAELRRRGLRRDVQVVQRAGRLFLRREGR